MIAADTHVHFYPCYDTTKSITTLISNLKSKDSSAVRAAFLTERKECCFFSDLRDGRIPLEGSLSVEEAGDEHTLLIKDDGAPALFIFAGRQIAAKERLEVLSLTSDVIIDDGLPVLETITRVRELGAVPCLTWALGKWTGKRRRIAGDIIESASPGELLVGDSSMRPSFLPEPDLMVRAAGRGLSVIAGSDPLPFDGDDQYMGTYATLIDGTLDESTPAASIRNILRKGPSAFRRVGERCGPISLITRQCKL